MISTCSSNNIFFFLFFFWSWNNIPSTNQILRTSLYSLWQV